MVVSVASNQLHPNLMTKRTYIEHNSLHAMVAQLVLWETIDRQKPLYVAVS